MQQIVASDPAANLQRRKKLHDLDELLEQLEQMHRHDINVLPEVAASMMRAKGLDLPTKGQVTVTAAIEAVWKAQEPFLLKGPDEKVKRTRRSRAQIEADREAGTKALTI
jgi:hypothetical protein